MNINVYIEEPLAKQLNESVKATGKPRNTIIREAIKEWVAHHKTKKWSKTILNFKGEPDFPAFENDRKELLPPKEDPFA